MFAAYVIAMALLARERTGKGQEVDLAMLDATVALLTYQAGNYFASGRVPARLGNRHPSIVHYETFTASDGDFVLAVGNDYQWQTFCGVAGFRRRPVRHQPSARVGLRFAAAARRRVAEEHTRQHWNTPDRRRRAVRVRPHLRELFADPQIDARG
jgi:crotonobetainyl-CoA:carnitine CoA-transferase CaiB-like acyl-CoA transferase